MKWYAGFEPGPAHVPVSAPTSAPYQTFQAKSFFATEKLKILNMSYRISKVFLIFSLINSKHCYTYWMRKYRLKRKSN